MHSVDLVLGLYSQAVLREGKSEEKDAQEHKPPSSYLEYFSGWYCYVDL